MTLLMWLIFIPGSLTVTFIPALLGVFLSSDASISSPMDFVPLENHSNYVVVSVSVDLPSNSKGMPPVSRHSL